MSCFGVRFRLKLSILKFYLNLIFVQLTALHVLQSPLQSPFRVGDFSGFRSSNLYTTSLGCVQFPSFCTVLQLIIFNDICTQYEVTLSHSNCLTVSVLNHAKFNILSLNLLRCQDTSHMFILQRGELLIDSLHLLSNSHMAPQQSLI